jgi:hypothetical protein
MVIYKLTLYEISFNLSIDSIAFPRKSLHIKSLSSTIRSRPQQPLFVGQNYEEVSIQLNQDSTITKNCNF